MNRTTHKKALFLIPIGLSMMVIVQVIGHATAIPDAGKGVLTGMGIGVLLTALLLSTQKTDTSSGM
ncbi:MAG: hypothetical protein AAFW89_05455 [Bacteroidota bacterium]